MKFPIVEVEWRDTFSVSNWTMLDSYDPIDLIIKSVGYLMREDENFTWVSQSISSSERKDNTIAIPRAVIIKIRKLK